MIGYIIISVFILMLIIFGYIAYKNERKYQKERNKKRQDTRKEEKKSARSPETKPTKVPSAKELEVKREQEERVKEKRLEDKRLQKIKLQEQRLEEKRLQGKKLEAKRLEEQRVKEEQSEPKNITISLADYPQFDHSRLIEMGLSEDEAKEFVAELIPQIAAQIPLIREALENADFHTMERLTHSIKGSSTTVGTGGISDLITDYNTYLKTGTEVAIAKAYFEQLNHYYIELKKQYLG